VLMGWQRNATSGCFETRRERTAQLLSSCNNNSNNPRRGTDQLCGAW